MFIEVVNKYKVFTKSFFSYTVVSFVYGYIISKEPI